MKREIISGVYKIRNIINGKLYIGSSFNIYKRWTNHKKDLKDKKHQLKLQNAWNKYGEQNFIFELIEVVDISECNTKLEIKNKLYKAEQYYLDDLLFANENNKKFDLLGYNICRIAEPSTLGYKNYIGVIYNKLKKSKSVYQYDLDGKFIRDWTSISETSKKYGASSISKACLGKQLTAYGYIWRFGSEIKNKNKTINSNEIKGLKKVPVFQYNTNGKFIKEFTSLADASVETMCDSSKICSVCSRDRKTAGGYVWRYKSDVNNKHYNVPIKEIVNSNAKPVLQYGVNKKLIKEWRSANYAGKTLDICGRMISNVCSSKTTKTYRGFIWKFKKP